MSFVYFTFSFKIESSSCSWITLCLCCCFRQKQILVGSIFSVFGALTSIRPGRTSMLGSSLITWGILRETLYAVYARRRIEVFTFPTLLIATLLAFLSIKSDVRYLIRSFRPRRQKKAWDCVGFICSVSTCFCFIELHSYIRIIFCNLFGLIT